MFHNKLTSIQLMIEKIEEEGQKQIEECGERMRRLKSECEKMIERKRKGKVCWDNETNRRK